MPEKGTRLQSTDPNRKHKHSLHTRTPKCLTDITVQCDVAAAVQHYRQGKVPKKHNEHEMMS